MAPIFAERDREMLIAALVDDELRLLQLVGVPGTYDEVRCTAALVMRPALEAQATGIVVAHNHPSGDERPSAADKTFTRNLALAAELLDITLIDHLIFDHGPTFSFRRAGLL